MKKPLIKILRRIVANLLLVTSLPAIAEIDEAVDRKSTR